MQNEKRVLLVSNSFPDEDSTGSEQRTANFYRVLTEKYEVDLLVIKSDKLFYITEQATRESAFRPVATDVIKKTRYLPKGIRTIVSDLLIYRGINPNNTNLFDSLLPGIIENAGYEFIICRYLHNYMHTGLFKAKYTTGKVFLDLDDIPWKMIISVQNVLGGDRIRKITGRISLFLIKWYSVFYIKRAAKVIVSNPNDLESAPALKSFCVLNIPKRYPFSPVSGSYDSNSILFVANFKYEPNIHGLYYFVTKIWKEIADNFSNTILEVVGSFDPEEDRIVEIKKTKGVRMLGFVEDLGEQYRNARFAVAPVYWGGGTKVKVIEALSFAKTVVMTQHAINGFERYLSDADSVFVAESDQVFIERCGTLLRDPELCRTMGMKGKEIIDREFSNDSFCKSLNQVLN